MSVRTVAKKDFTGVRRSKTVWAGAVTLGLLAVVVGFVTRGYRQTSVEAVQGTFWGLTRLLAILLPLVALTAAYMAIAGEREGGGIKFLLSLPNTRRELFVGKLLSRLALVAAGVALTYVAASSIAVSKHGVLPLAIVAGTLALSILYGSAFVSIAVAVSAAAATRSRAIASALASYFVLVVLYVFPVVQVKTAVEVLHTAVLGMEANPDLYNAVHYTSPFLAYQKALNLVVPDRLQTRPFRDSAANGAAGGSAGGQAGGSASASGGSGAGSAAQSPPADLDLPLYLTDEFSLVILAFWLVVPLLVGYWAFERADLE